MSLDADLLQEFAAESEDHLDTLERRLSAGAVADRAGVDALFRGFHSLKGMADALGLGGMSVLAHRCEDILGAARTGRVAVGGAVADALLAAVDGLRRQREAMLAGQPGPAPDPALLARLGACLGDAASAPAAEPLLASLASRLAEAAPALARLRGQDAAAAAEARDLAAAARLIGLERLAATLGALADGDAALPAFGALRRLLLLLDARGGEEAGATALAAALHARDADAIRPALGTLAAALDAGAADAGAAREAAAVATALGLDEVEALLLELEDLLDRAAEPEAAAVLAREATAIGARLRAAAGAADPTPDPIPAGAVTMRIRQDTVDEIIALEAEARAAALSLGETLHDEAAATALATLARIETRLTGPLAREMAGAQDSLRRLVERLGAAESRLALALRQLDEAVLGLRVVPIGTLFARLPRAMRAVAEAAGKQVELVTEGEEVGLDRGLVELLADPLLHLVRNAVDHGIETPAERLAAGKPPRATLALRATRQPGRIRVTISDDGRGIDRDAVLRQAVRRGLVAPEAAATLGDAEIRALLLTPGFSTAEAVTATSGRGVGLDVVAEAARRAGGTLDLASEPGRGTTFTLFLPVSAAVQAVLLVEVGGQPYALPAARVEAVLADDAAPGCPVVALHAALGLAPRAEAPGGLVLVRAQGQALALRVDQVRRRANLLLRPLHPGFAGLPAVAGVGVLGNGDPVVVLEPDGLAG